MYDAFGRTASRKVSLMIDPYVPKMSSKPRGSLFELDDMDLEKAAVKGPVV